MVTVGLCLIACAHLSPDEYNLLLDHNGNLDLGILWSMRQIQQEALNKAAELFPGITLWNDRGDAFRHAYWNALMTKDFGGDFAIAFSTAHETQFSLQPNLGEAFMDLHNNSIGVEIAVSSPKASNEQLQTLVMVALNYGIKGDILE